MADDQTQVSMPWYKSKILQGILVTFVLQVLSRTKFASLFTNDQVTSIIGYVFDGISAAALWYSTHARVTQKTVSPLVSSQAKADTVNQEVKK